MSRLEISAGRRYLVPFSPKRVQHVFTDVLVIGGGIAGIRAAMAAETDQDVIVVTKDVQSESNSSYAQGGIAGVLDPLDDIASHAADTITAGKGLCDSAVVEAVVREAPQHIRDLVGWGADFDKQDGELALTREGGHSHARVAHALGDATGKEIMRALREYIQQSAHIQLWERTFTIDLITHEGECCGALVWNDRHGKTLVWAKQTVLATGGAGQLYRESTNPEIATADGHAIAFRAGAELRDMEFMQFHPTVLYIAGSSRHLISEAVRGEGAYLRDVFGERFMESYDPLCELAPRDIVSQAITRQMQKTNHPCVYLDLTHVPPDHVHKRFPHIGKVCREFGIDITSDPVPVRPGAHYMIGGVTVDLQAATSLPRLWAAGEVTSSGLHGANRLGSNSLIEGLVFGSRAGANAAQAARGASDSFTAIAVAMQDLPADSNQDDLNLLDLRNSLASLMSRAVGIERDAEGLDAAARQVQFWDRYVLQREFQNPSGWELQNMLIVGQLMIMAARERCESRGVHYRSDFPEPSTEPPEHIALVAADFD